MTMCAACSALRQGGSEHAALMSRGRRNYLGRGKNKSGAGELFVCRLCGAEWLRENGMHPVPKKKNGWSLPLLR